MPALFTRRDDRRLKTIMVALGLGCVSAALAPMGWVRAPLNTRQYAPLRQPVPFDHRHHVLDAGIDCEFCHAGALREAQAGIPAPDVCMQCHEQIWPDADILAPVRSHFKEGTAVPWRRVHRLPAYVYFHHGAHTQRGVPCVACHGHVERMAAVWQEEPLTMAWCLDCHREHSRDKTGVDVSTRKPQGDSPHNQGADGRASAPELSAGAIAPPLHCSGCHR